MNNFAPHHAVQRVTKRQAAFAFFTLVFGQTTKKAAEPNRRVTCAAKRCIP